MHQSHTQQHHQQQQQQQPQSQPPSNHNTLNHQSHHQQPTTHRPHQAQPVQHQHQSQPQHPHPHPHLIQQQPPHHHPVTQAQQQQPMHANQATPNMHLPTAMHPTPPQAQPQQPGAQHHSHHQNPQQQQSQPQPPPHQQHHHHQQPQQSHPNVSHPQQLHHTPHHPTHIAHSHPNSNQHHLNQHQPPLMHAQQRQQQQHLQTHMNQHHQHPHQHNQQSHHPHHHQHHLSQAHHQMPPPPAHYHMTHGPGMIMNPPQYPNMMYAPMNAHFVAHSGHIQPPFNHASNPNHRADHINVNPQGQPPTQQNPQTSQQPQPQPTSQQTNSINPNNITQHVGPVPSPIVSTSSASNTGVQQLNNSPVMDPHMQTRLPMNPPYLMSNAYMNPLNIQMMPYPMGNAYPGPHLPPQHNPALMPPRIPAELGVRPPTLEPHNHVAPLPNAAPLAPAPVVLAPKSGVPVPVSAIVPPVTSAAPPGPIKPRVRKALAIVDPETRHVYTEDELKSFPSNTSNTGSTDTASGNSTATSTGDPSSTEATATTEQSEANYTNNTKTQVANTPTIQANKTSPQVTSTTTNASISSTEGTPGNTCSPSTSTSSTASSKSPTTTSQVDITAQQSVSPNVTRADDLDITMQKLSISESLSVPENIATSDAIVNDKHVTDPRVVEPNNHLEDGGSVKGDTVDHVKTIDLVPEIVMQSESPEKKLDPSLPYEEGQYSPSNRSGRKKYSIQFLKAVCAAMGMDFTVIHNDRPMNDLFKPNYVNDNHYNNYRDAGPLPRRASQQMIHKPPRKIIATHSLQPEVELKTVENAWRPELETDKSKAVETGEMDTTRLLKIFRGHLNKLTPQKYDSIIQKVADLDLSGDSRLKSVIDLVFDKAVDEPGFCELYARMCKVIAARNNEFCFHLVKKCQEEFETTDLYDGLNVESRTAAIEAETDATKKKYLEDELYEDMRLRRKKYLGTIKLIGEMYKFGLLIPKIIGLCMKHLMIEANNENLECLCSLITTVGVKMASESDADVKHALKHYLDMLHNFAYSKKSQSAFVLESRIKFKILDTIDLSKRNWKPRMVENNPKKIEEIREEAKQEELLQQRHHNHPKNMMKNDDRDRNRRPGGNMSSFTKSGSGSKWP